MQDGLEKLAEGVWLRLLSRFAMIAAICFMPVVGYIGKRIIDSNDRAVAQLQDTTITVRVIQAEIREARAARDAQFALFGRELQDHEGRIRTLESRR